MLSQRDNGQLSSPGPLPFAQLVSLTSLVLCCVLASAGVDTNVISAWFSECQCGRASNLLGKAVGATMNPQLSQLLVCLSPVISFTTNP